MIWPDPHSPSFTQKVIYLFMDVPEVLINLTLRKGLHDFTGDRIFTFNRALGQIIDTGAMQFTHWTFEFDFREHGSLMKGQESLHFHRKRRIAVVSLQNMIEQVVTGFGFFEASLESNQTNGGVSYKIVSDIPCVCTFWAYFKRIHFQLFLVITDFR